MIHKLPPGTPEVYLDTLSYTDRTVGYLIVKKHGVQLWRGCSIELPWLDNAKGVSCFAVGDYPLILERSDRFDKELWEIKDTPGRSECKVHNASYVSQLEGCVAPGLSFADINKDGVIDVVNSKIALAEFHAAMGDARKSIIHVTSIMGSRVLGPGMNGYRGS